jgi:hypothetical protein
MLTWGMIKAPFSCWVAGEGTEGGQGLLEGCGSFLDAAKMDWMEAFGSDKGGGVEEVFRAG